jgi:hypothetical protein
MRAARELRQGFDTTKLKELDAPLKLILAEAQGLGLPVGKLIQAMLDAGSVTFNAGTISLHDEIGVPLRSLGVGSSRLLVAALQRKASTLSTTFLIDELEYGLEPHRIIRLLATLGAKDEVPTVQVFATSHSPVVAAELNAAQLFVVRRGTPGHAVLQASQAVDVQGAMGRECWAPVTTKALVQSADDSDFARAFAHDDFGGEQGVRIGADGAPECLVAVAVDQRGAIAFQALGYRVAILRG